MITMTAAVRDMSITVLCSPNDFAKTVGNANDRHETRSMVTLTRALLTKKACSFSITNRMPPPESSWSSSDSEREWLASSPAAGARPLLPISTRPPKKKDMPSTSRRLESTDPSSVAFTTSSSPTRSVCMVMIISTAFPKVAFSRPLITSLWRQASSSSVASPRILASGIIAMKFSQKVHSALQPASADQAPRGNASSMMLKGCCRMDFRPPRFLSQ
mmetsp:Transcript_24005/g.63280  ORF Transcript_24005/g.63280 Transcript_24005/m.63280 type:complete len:217 (+) Transcript_24005:653-1303(+)